MYTTHALKWVAASAVLVTGVAATHAGDAHADDDHCSSRTGCYHGPGMRWCPGDHVWPGLRAIGWEQLHGRREECERVLGLICAFAP
jgi:hypothetical protein